MEAETFSFTDDDNVQITAYRWMPERGVAPKGVINVIHGMGEHMARYRWLADRLQVEGYLVYGVDHRGHGRTRTDHSSFGYLGPDGFHGMVRNARQLSAVIAQEQPGLPIFLFGHSLGSFAALHYAEEYGDEISGLILSGSSGKQSPLIHVGIHLASRTMAKRGAESDSPLVNRLVFGGYNKRIRSLRTPVDWLSRDEAEVDLYRDDPLCGRFLTIGSLYDMFHGLVETHRRARLQRIPKTLPILLMSGLDDPVGRYGKGVRSLERSLRQQSMLDVDTHLYPGARHELFHEINRDEVMVDLLSWLNVRTGSQARK